MESMERWEELQEVESENCIQEDVPKQEWTRKGFQEAGDIVENVLCEVMVCWEIGAL